MAGMLYRDGLADSRSFGDAAAYASARLGLMESTPAAIDAAAFLEAVARAVATGRKGAFDPDQAPQLARALEDAATASDNDRSTATLRHAARLLMRLHSDAHALDGVVTVERTS